jgi:hypothetical protein
MAKIEYDEKDKNHKLGGSMDTDLEELDSKYEVFTDDVKLAAAQGDFPNYTWFASYSIKEGGKDVQELPHDYVIKFDKPENPNSKCYYYLQGSVNNKGTIHEVNFEATANKGNKQRVKAYLKIGDPPIGYYP